ncbi:DUF1707 SHOCT-like domain-containing protein [Phytohabitans rumicis]|nr:DUF1707 domain-containing protein [Phytohabitans rumicis]
MRAADDDRHAVAERLRTALNEGRLDLHEYDERLQRAYTAKTYGDLDRLLADLPGTVPLERSQVVPAGARPDLDLPYSDATRRWLIDVWERYAGVVAITVGIWAVICLMAQDLIYFWPGWVAGPWGAVLLVQTVTGLMSGEPQKWAAKKARKKAAKADKKASKEAESDG